MSGGFPACCGDLDLVLPNGTVDAECRGHCVNETQCLSEGAGDLVLPPDPNPDFQGGNSNGKKNCMNFGLNKFRT